MVGSQIRLDNFLIFSAPQYHNIIIISTSATAVIQPVEKLQHSFFKWLTDSSSAVPDFIDPNTSNRNIFPHYTRNIM